MPQTDEETFSGLRKQAFKAVSEAHKILHSPRTYCALPDLSLTVESIDQEVKARVEAGLEATRESIREERITRNEQRRKTFETRQRLGKSADQFLEMIEYLVFEARRCGPARKAGRPFLLDRYVLGIAATIASGKTVNDAVTHEKELHAARTLLPRFYQRIYILLSKAYPQVVDEVSGLFQPKYVTDGMFREVLEDLYDADTIKNLREDIPTFRWAASRHYDTLLARQPRVSTLRRNS